MMSRVEPMAAVGTPVWRSLGPVDMTMWVFIGRSVRNSMLDPINPTITDTMRSVKFSVKNSMKGRV